MRSVLIFGIVFVMGVIAVQLTTQTLNGAKQLSAADVCEKEAQKFCSLILKPGQDPTACLSDYANQCEKTINLPK